MEQLPAHGLRTRDLKLSIANPRRTFDHWNDVILAREEIVKSILSVLLDLNSEIDRPLSGKKRRFLSYSCEILCYMLPCIGISAVFGVGQSVQSAQGPPDFLIPALLSGGPQVSGHPPFLGSL